MSTQIRYSLKRANDLLSRVEEWGNGSTTFPGVLLEDIRSHLDAVVWGHVGDGSVSTDKLDLESRHVGDDDTESVLGEDDSLKSG